MIAGSEIVAALVEMRVTHVVWLPDSTLGTWEAALVQEPSVDLVRVCREGEAWAVAAGLHLGGARPLVMIQNTGLFESGDALRNVLFDLGLPIYTLVGYRGYLLAGSTDTARRFTEPVLAAWGLPTILIQRADDLPRLAADYAAMRASGSPRVALLAEGTG